MFIRTAMLAAALALVASSSGQAQDDWPRWKKHGEQPRYTHNDALFQCDFRGGLAGLLPYVGGFIAPSVARECEAELEQKRRRYARDGKAPPRGLTLQEVTALITKKIAEIPRGESDDELLERLKKSGKLDAYIKGKVNDSIVALLEKKARPAAPPAPEAAPEAESSLPKAPAPTPRQWQGFIQAVLRADEMPRLTPLAITPVPESDPRSGRAEMVYVPE